MYCFSNLTIPKNRTHRHVVEQIATEFHIPVEYLAEDLDQPVFTRGQVVFDFVGDALDDIARNYTDMQWWVSDRGLNMDIVSPAEHSEPSKSTIIAQRATRRRLVVLPILVKRRWTPCRLAAKAGLGKNSVYQYLDGTRAKITDVNRKAIAETLGLRPGQLPE